jgi:putative DNA primase/helicase
VVAVALVNARDLADRLGLARQAKSWRGSCPACGYSNAFSLMATKADRFRVFAACGCEREVVEDAVRRIVGGDALPATRREAADTVEARQRRREAARRTWDGSTPAAGTIVAKYLAGRALPGLAASAALRFRGDCRHPGGARLPAMVAEVVDVNGVFIGMHRTFLRPDGSAKADVEPQRASLGSLWGGAVRLSPIGDELVVGEGIETSASAGELLGLPAWAALSAGNLANGVVLPAEVRAVVVAADADPPGERAAGQAALRWRREGRTVRVACPDKAGSDFNDVLRGRDDG